MIRNVSHKNSSSPLPSKFHLKVCKTTVQCVEVFLPIDHVPMRKTSTDSFGCCHFYERNTSSQVNDVPFEKLISAKNNRLLMLWSRPAPSCVGNGSS